MTLIVRQLGRVAYDTALAIQQDLLAGKLRGDEADYLLLLEHEPVYTLGRGADERDLCGADRLLGVPAHRTGRGGGVTFHGPGQLVGYPILTLRRPDVRAYVTALEQVLIDCCAHWRLSAERRAGLRGVWVGERKIAAIGVAIARSNTSHGVALNVDTDLSFFDAIVPCRLQGTKATSLARELGAAPPMAVVREVFETCFRRQFGYSSEEPARELRA